MRPAVALLVLLGALLTGACSDNEDPQASRCGKVEEAAERQFKVYASATAAATPSTSNSGNDVLDEVLDERAQERAVEAGAQALEEYRIALRVVLGDPDCFDPQTVARARDQIAQMGG